MKEVRMPKVHGSSEGVVCMSIVTQGIKKKLQQCTLMEPHCISCLYVITLTKQQYLYTATKNKECVHPSCCKLK